MAYSWLARRFGFLALTAACLFLVSPSWAADEEKPELPEPESVTRETKDGVACHLIYYPGTLGKKSVPVILLHGWGGQGSDYEGLAKRLQEAGHASIMPDLRGFGRTNTYKNAKGEIKDFDVERFRAAAIESMVNDVDVAYKFLLEKNNAGELNIEALCVVGADFSTIVALNWTKDNWQQPMLPAYKLGQDVKALVLLSPVASFKGTTNRDALAHPIVKARLSTLIAVGEQESKSFGEAKRLHRSLSAFHIKPPTDPEEQKAKMDLFFVSPKTSLQGTKLLDPSLPVANNILGFINLRLVAKMDDFKWQNRENPL